jgi:hypothetical protein
MDTDLEKQSQKLLSLYDICLPVMLIVAGSFVC